MRCACAVSDQAVCVGTVTASHQRHAIDVMYILCVYIGKVHYMYLYRGIYI